MAVGTEIRNAVSAADEDAQYDEKAKRLLGYKSNEVREVYEMSEYGQRRNGQSGEDSSGGQVRQNARRSEKKVLLDIVSYRCESDNWHALYDEFWNEFRKYSNEPNHMLPRIQGKIRQILQSRPQTGFDSERGWLLARRTACEKYIPDRYPVCTVRKYDEIYYLTPDGQFVRYTYEFKNTWNSKDKRIRCYDEKDWQRQEISLEQVAETLDFQVYYRWMRNFSKDGQDYEWLDTYDSISKFREFYHVGYGNGATAKAERLYAEKGVGLYRLLCAVLNESEYYVRICAKINSRLDEIARDQQARKDRMSEHVNKAEVIKDEKEPVGLLKRIYSFFS